MTLGATIRRNFPTLKHVATPFRWFFRSRRRVLTAAAVLLAMLVTPPLWWSVQLLGLPDIGEPFDMQAFRSFTIPDDRNAFVLYREAAGLLRYFDPSRGSIRRLDPRWSNAEPAYRQWLDDNRAALEVYRRGSERPDAFGVSTPHDREYHPLLSALSTLHYLAMLEASRLEERGDMAEAWTWYRAALRANYHQGRRASGDLRASAQILQGPLIGRVYAWAEDSRTTPANLRRALADLIACEAILPSDADTIKFEYPAMEKLLDGPDNPGQAEPYARLSTVFKSWEIRPTPEQLHRLALAWREWRRESERSRRVLRLAIANWLAYYELPRKRRPKPSPGLRGPVPFYELSPKAPAGARAVSPEELSRWLASTIDADALLRSSGFLQRFRSVMLQDQVNYQALVLRVASELYRRERGTYPPSDEALVGPYLESLPDDGAAEAENVPGRRAAGAVQ